MLHGPSPRPYTHTHQPPCALGGQGGQAQFPRGLVEHLHDALIDRIDPHLSATSTHTHRFLVRRPVAAGRRRQAPPATWEGSMAARRRCRRDDDDGGHDSGGAVCGGEEGWGREAAAAVLCMGRHPVRFCGRAGRSIEAETEVCAPIDARRNPPQPTLQPSQSINPLLESHICTHNDNNLAGSGAPTPRRPPPPCPCPSRKT